LPIVKPVPPGSKLRVAPVPLIQYIEVREPQVPEYSSIYAVPDCMLEPILLNAIVGKADVVVKEYHTSAPGEPEQLLETVGLETVAPAKVPPVLTQEEPGVKVIAPEQASLAGGEFGARWVIQILKVPVVAALSDPTLIR
jgi:hypothetical protein